MSVKIVGLSKYFGTQKAVDDIGFEVNKGEVLGFLGPNGAGKSTAMKMATGLLLPSAGSVLINGEELTEKALHLKRKIGYLPESNPLYYDMYVHEYLGYIASLYGFSSGDRRARVRQMVELCGLRIEQNKKIGTLSKGYKQRVGLAQALIHDPEVLILDEPNTGLDPNQLVEIRELIKGVSKDKTVIFSTHIMQEVEAICSRVLVINKGRIVTDQSIEGLQNETGRSTYLVQYKKKMTDVFYLKMPFLAQFEHKSNGEVLVYGKEGIHNLAERIFNYSVEHGQVLLSLIKQENSLEDIFHQLTKATE